MLVGFVTLPLTVHYLGPVEYGVWITISTTATLLALLDLGIANTLTNSISEAYARDSRSDARAAYSTAFWMTTVVATLLAMVAILLWSWLDWGKLLHLEGAVLVHQARTTVLICILFFFVSMPLNLANRVMAGYQQVHITNYFAMGISVLGLIAILTGVLVRGTIVTLMSAYCGAMLLGALLLNLWLLLHHKPWLRPNPLLIDRSVAKSMLRQGFMFFLMQITMMVVFNSDNLVIMHFRGPNEVTPYSVAWRLVNYAVLLQSLMVPTLWPAFTEAYEKRDMVWVRKAYHGIFRTTLGLVSLSAIMLAAFGRTIIRLWAGPAAVPSSLLLWTLAVWTVVVCSTTNQALLMTATKQLRVATISAITAAIANLTLSIYLVKRMGAEGVILATVISFLVFMIVPQGMEVRRILRGDFLPAAKDGEAGACPITSPGEAHS